MSAGVKRSHDEAEEQDVLAKRQVTGDGISSGDETQMALKILIGNKSAGSVIGKAGATINSIKDTSGAKVKVSSNSETFPGTADRIVLISGKVETVLSAAKMVISEMYRDPNSGRVPDDVNAVMTVSIVIPAAACGLVIGKGGEKINSLREETQAKIQLQAKDKVAIPGLNERIVTIQGTLPQAQTAVEKIVHLIHEDGNIRYENLGTNYGMSGMMGKGLGQGYGMGMMPMQGAAAMYGGMQMPMGMDMASQGMGMAPGMPGVVPGQEYWGMSQHGLGTDMHTVLKLSITDDAVGPLLGKGGCNLKEYISVSGANIKVSQRGDTIPGTNNRYITIQGTAAAVQYAQLLVLQKAPNATPV
ncbi:hypothetical protein GUITHDRAFT_101621 [Guillardia theta CCMP2712]|uniref:K Homology domain-containing protein n=1 Tax=Guillardia theta (strain CCMP2712) TaxID=905079 RepID=L1JW68_GUITC|nr:hypothetical protein GUITHDRAFT_101621 [Guillardia theta CCMP2712]EKX52450.1 hypothetical protein GUITHDRAFT_101621 [Guillardia theta CCMP2712]|mmetsp:Transcript_10137/g.33780  ORF Transcript_10137/g.33780 Transcript_10137/m.33780 type:complete len:359 (-) Transcript_10137:126-1202(-)|eukprot:XP_005839430.1 hypothetical protein GUITHDRAFT_101621 [Guillardia theta CCMP2712]